MRHRNLALRKGRRVIKHHDLLWVARKCLCRCVENAVCLLPLHKRCVPGHEGSHVEGQSKPG